MKNKLFDKKLNIFIAGFLVGSFLTFSFLGTAFVFYKLGKRSGNLSPGFIAQKIKNKLNIPEVKRPGGISDVKLSFEEKEMEWFSPSGGSKAEKSLKYVTDGKYSLFAQLPSSAKYPGLTWEVYKAKDSINLRNAKFLVFDVYNEGKKEASLYIKLKSGANYPKKTYQTIERLKPEDHNTVRIPVSELASALDVSQISYINLFLDKPHSEFNLYFDNIRVE